MKSRFFSIPLLFCAAMLLAGAGSLPRHAVPLDFDSGRACPVMPGQKVRSKFYVDYKGQRIYLCCRSCEKAFKRNPANYL